MGNHALDPRGHPVLRWRFSGNKNNKTYLADPPDRLWAVPSGYPCRPLRAAACDSAEPTFAFTGLCRYSDSESEAASDRTARLPMPIKVPMSCADACPPMLCVCCACDGAGSLLSSRAFARPAVSPRLKAMVTAQLAMNVVSGQPESITQPCSMHAAMLAKGIVKGGQHAS